MIGLSLAQPARATHESIVIDGDLTDLIAAIERNRGPSHGGFAIPDLIGEIYTAHCRFVNGFDVKNYYVFLDLKDRDGRRAGNATLYLGWDVVGVIGDTDGDGIPDEFGGLTHQTCAAWDGPPGVVIGPEERYRADIDLNCDGVGDIVIELTDDTIEILPAPPPGDPALPDTFAVNGGFLEARIGRLDKIVPGIDLGNARIRMRAGSEIDGLGEDASSLVALDVEHSVAVALTPAERVASSGQVLEWTIAVTNDGLSTVHALHVADLLPEGLTYVASEPQRTSGDARRSEWDLTQPLHPGESRTIQLRGRVGPDCVPRNETTVSVEAVREPPSLCGMPAFSVLVSTSGIVTCEDPLAVERPAGPWRRGLLASYPNPTRGATRIRYASRDGGPVHLTLHDLQGRQVASVAAGVQQAGEHEVVWNGLADDGRSLEPGVYLLRLQSRDGTQTMRLVLMR